MRPVAHNIHFCILHLMVLVIALPLFEALNSILVNGALLFFSEDFTIDTFCLNENSH